MWYLLHHWIVSKEDWTSIGETVVTPLIRASLYWETSEQPTGHIGRTRRLKKKVKVKVKVWILWRFKNVFRPPGTVVREVFYFVRNVFFLSFLFRHAFSEVPRPIALKLGHMVGNCLNFIIQVQKFGGPSPKKIRGPKTCKISVDYIQPPTLIAKISGTAQDI